MVYDCFSFFDELDLLEIRLNELSKVVDRFVVVEATLTHNGAPKPLYFAENAPRFKEFEDRIIHVVVNDFSAVSMDASFQEQAWMRENIQRNGITRGLVGAKPDDIVIISDLDEIPSSAVLKRAISNYRSGEVVGFRIANYAYFMNLRNASSPYFHDTPKFADCRTFVSPQTYLGARYCHYVLKSVNVPPTATLFRYVKSSRRVKNGGWHFSHLGGIDAVVAKIKAFNEVGLYAKEDLREYVSARISAGRALSGMDRLLPESPDRILPIFVLSHKERFQHLICPVRKIPHWAAWFLMRWYHVAQMSRHIMGKVLFKVFPQRARILILRLMYGKDVA